MKINIGIMASKRTRQRRVKEELDSILGFDTYNTKVVQFRPNYDIMQIDNNTEETLNNEIIPEYSAQELLSDSPQLTPDQSLFKV